MKKQEKKIKEIRSKEKWLSGEKHRWVLTKTSDGNLWKHCCTYTNEETTALLVTETKRGFTFSVYFAGKYTNHFVSRGDCEIFTL